MSDLPDGYDVTIHEKLIAVRRLLKNEFLWFGIALLMLIFGMIAQFEIAWIPGAAAGIVLSMAAYGILPGVKEKKRIAWEIGREALLEKWSLVVAKLGKSSKERYNKLHLRVSRLGDLHSSPRSGSQLRTGEYLLWLYLKLLLALDLLDEGAVHSSEKSILDQKDQILRDLGDLGLSNISRHSKEETLLILDQRLDTAKNRLTRMQEIESDLTRIEQKLALMFDRAAQHNTMGDSGRRINFSDEIQTAASLNSLLGSPVEEMDQLVTQQVCA